ncbi:uncharacterized protein LOC114305299, partial [Camellia sinensis]|uniref:uncharacterized protein LOC114305299 n=1 Tax=Camellia sinensis TaxID=4442 RepID=UPI0010361C89
MPTDPSWVWRKLLSLRNLTFPLIKFKIGNGENVFLWFDNWHPLCSLWHRYGQRILYDTNFLDSSKVSSIISNGSWMWPIPNTWEINEWISSTPPTLNPSNSLDTPFWSLNADGVFSIHSTWDYWRAKGPKVRWSKLIWGPPLIPRVSFVVWLAINERLNTGDRLQMFGIVPNPSCHFCQAPESNHTHLFFRCAYSSKIWVAVQTKCNTSCPNLSWVETVDYATKTLKGKTLQSVKEAITYSFSLWVLCEDVSSGSSEFRYSSITLYWADNEQRPMKSLIWNLIAIMGLIDGQLQGRFKHLNTVSSSTE